MQKVIYGLFLAFTSVALVGCGDGPCAAGFSFKYCLNQSSSSSSAPTYTVGGTVTGLGAAQTVTLALTRPAVSFAAPSSDPASFTGSGTVGWSFTVDANKSISYLGLYNTELNADTTVAIWNSSGQQVTSLDFTQAAISSAELDASGFFWLPVTKELSPGQYTIGAFANADHFGVHSITAVTTYGLQLGTMSLFGSSASAEKPAESIKDVYPNGFFGPNLRFSTQKTISANGAFTFDAPLLNSELYTVTVSSQPAGATCVLTNASGKLNSTGVTNVTVTCTQNSAS